jgi:hypothetical protein
MIQAKKNTGRLPAPPKKPADRTAGPQTAALMTPRDGYVFIVTYGRSGSTLTQNLLNAIPGYCIRGENGNAIAPLCRSINLIVNEPQFVNRRRLRASGKPLVPMDTADTPWFGADLIDVDSYARALLDVFVDQILNLPAGTRVGGFKEIRYMNDLAFLPRQLEIMQQYFPKARLIFLTRNHSEVANSSWWKTQPEQDVRKKLAAADQAFHAYRASHEGCFHLDYSQFKADTEALRPLFEFLGEPFDPALVDRVLQRKLTHAQGPQA